MTLIGDLLARDLSKKIEEIVKLDQTDEQSVFSEITEYVATDRLRRHYRDLFRAIAEAPADPNEGVGVWISGFFGSGKSSFAKNVGYVIANRMVLGHKAADLFKAQLGDEIGTNLIDSINARIPTEVVMFDVQTDRASGGSGNVSIAHYMYRSLLRAFDYAEDFEIADLEQSLEVDNRLQEFEDRCLKLFGEWRKRRKLARKFNEAGAVLSEMDPKTYPNAESWAHSMKRIEVTPAFLVEKTFELAARRRPGKALSFVVDEVGGYVARSAERIEDLRAVVEQFGKEGKNRVKARKVLAPVWVVVTSQEKLDEVVAALDSKRVELAKLQDRFPHRIDIGPTDIREVVQKRVLAKKPGTVKELERLFDDHEGQINAHLKIERTSRKTEIGKKDFVDFYPYPAHFIELSIDIMSGIRLQPGAPRHLGGSNRTIIRQAFEMLVSERTALAKAETGRLVTLDLIFELVEGNLASEKQKDLSDIAVMFGVSSWEFRVAKAIALLEFVRDIPRTEVNLAAVLYDRIGGPSSIAEVKEALKRLFEAKFIRQTEEGFKLQTAAEKSWETERRSIDPRPRDRAEILREGVRDVFSEPALRSYSYKGQKSFKIELTVDKTKLEDGQLPLRIVAAESEEKFPGVLSETQAESRAEGAQDLVFFVFPVKAEIDDLIAELFRSRQMVSRYSQIAAQGKIRTEESTCLTAEKDQVLRMQKRLRDALTQALMAGTSYFRGNSKEAGTLGKALGDVFRGLFDWAVPSLYEKLEMGSVPLKGDEAEDVLKAANLSGLPAFFYDGENGLSLVKKDGAKFIANANAPVAKEILDYIRRRTSYGEKVTGKDLENHFSGLGYGWERDLLRVVLAVLLRAGAVEVTFQGRRFRSHQEPLVRSAFAGTQPFRSASFSPREAISLKTLTTAASYLESLTGHEVDVEESAIAQAFKKLASEERTPLVETLATVHAAGLPAETSLSEYMSTLNTVVESSTDDAVRMLAEERKSFAESRDRARKIREAVKSPKFDEYRAARQTVPEMWKELQVQGATVGLETAKEDFDELTADLEVYGGVDKACAHARQIQDGFGELYSRVHAARDQEVAKQLEIARAAFGWQEIPDEMLPLFGPLMQRYCAHFDRNAGALVCGSCRATMKQLESDIAAAGSIRKQIVQKLQAQKAPQEKVERLSMRELCPEPLDSEESVKSFLSALESRLLKLIAEGFRIVVE